MPGVVVRVWLPDRPGALGLVASRIGAIGGDIVGIDVLERSEHVAVDEFAVLLPDKDLVALLVREIEEVDGASVETWHRADDLRAAVTLAIVDRGDVVASTPPPGWRCLPVHMPRLDVSSTDLRRRIGAGESVDFLVPPSAARVLRARGLYTGG